MRLPLVSNIVPGGMNALYQQMLNNQILAAKAKYAQQSQQGQAQQAQAQGNILAQQVPYAGQTAQGLAQQAQAQGKILSAQAPFAGEAAQGIAQEESGLGKSALAKGYVAVPYQNALLKNTQMQPAATQADINLANAETSNVTNTAQQIPSNSAAQRYVELTQAYRNANPNATAAQVQSWFQSNYPQLFASMNSNAQAAVPPGTQSAIPGSTSGMIKGQYYSQIRQRNGKTEYKLSNGIWAFPN